MKHDAVSIYKEKLGFLENYGFVLSVNPYDSNSLCYKNEYGEIIIGTDYQSGIGKSTDIYIQINGWRQNINIEEEYKKHLCKSTFLKSDYKLFKELFTFIVSKTGSFYNLKINCFNVNNYKLEYSNYIPNRQFKVPTLLNERVIITVTIISVILFLFILFTLFGLNNYLNHTALYYFELICYIFILSMSLMIVILFRKSLFIGSIIYMILYPIMLLLTLHSLNIRMNHLIYLISFAVGILLILYGLIHFIVTKRKKIIGSSLISIIFPIFISMYKSYELISYVHFIDNMVLTFFISALIISAISMILAIIFTKDRSNKKHMIGLSCGVFFTVLVFSFIVPNFVYINLNYTFDNSDGKVETFVITDKYYRLGTGRYSSTKYYLVFTLNGKEERISINKRIYDEYDITDELVLIHYDGFFDDDYYEVQVNQNK